MFGLNWNNCVLPNLCQEIGECLDQWNDLRMEGRTTIADNLQKANQLLT